MTTREVSCSISFTIEDSFPPTCLRWAHRCPRSTARAPTSQCDSVHFRTSIRRHAVMPLKPKLSIFTHPTFLKPVEPNDLLAYLRSTVLVDRLPADCDEPTPEQL